MMTMIIIIIITFVIRTNHIWDYWQDCSVPIDCFYAGFDFSSFMFFFLLFKTILVWMCTLQLNCNYQENYWTYMIQFLGVSKSHILLHGPVPIHWGATGHCSPRTSWGFFPGGDCCPLHQYWPVMNGKPQSICYFAATLVLYFIRRADCTMFST